YDLKDGSERWLVRATSSACSTPVVGDGYLFLAAHGMGSVEGEAEEPPSFDTMLKKYDKDGDGQISLAEFPSELNLIQRPDLPDEKLPLKLLFRGIDSNGDGKINRPEWEKFLKRFRWQSSLRLNGLLAIKPGTQGDVTKTNIAWREEHALPEVASPIC